MQPALCERLVECALVDHSASRHLQAKRRTLTLTLTLTSPNPNPNVAQLPAKRRAIGG